MIARLQHALIAVVLGVLTVAALHTGHRDVGYARDEGIYFEASRRYADWLVLLSEDPSRANERKVRDRFLAVNHEHPALMKMVGGVSARLLAEAPEPGTSVGKHDVGGRMPTMPEGAAMRLPAQLLAGLGVALLYLAGAALGGGITSGLLAAGWFVLNPRVFFHAGLHAFDVPVAVAMIWVVLAYRRALHSRAWGIALGPLLGVAIAVKHNALFVPILLTAHWFAVVLWARFRDRRPIATAQWLPLPLWSMATLAPLTAYSLWPWLWTAPVKRMTEYLAFHRQHNWYNMEFLGDNFNQPPMPSSFPWVMTWATVPSVLLLLAVVGLVVLLRRDVTRPPPTASGPAPQHAEGSWWQPLGADWARLDGLLLLVFGAFPLVLIALPTTPIFGATKHWLTAYPFLALAAAAGWGHLWQRSGIGRRRRTWMMPAALVLVLGPGTLATVRGHPYGLSQYAPLVGGPRGAARLGLNRGFWGHAVVELLPTMEGRRVFVHDLHDLARKQYAREGRWPQGAKSVGIGQADAALLFHEKHMATYEFPIWERTGSTGPQAVITLHDVPLTRYYAR